MRDHVLYRRLSHVLKLHRERLKSGPKLAQAIRAADPDGEDSSIDRRTLDRLCSADYEKVTLKLGQLIALDEFCVASGEPSLFARDESLIDALAESLEVHFMVAAKPWNDSHDDGISRWDLRAITELLGTRLNQLHFRIWDIAGPDNWRHDVVPTGAFARIAIASPIANPAAEVLMSNMARIAPNEKCDISQLPFCIIGADRDSALKSAFVRSRDELACFDQGAVALSPNYRGLVVGRTLYRSNEREDYALLVAQRDAVTGHVQMVLCGLTGQGTHELATMLRSGRPRQSLPELRKGQQHPPIAVTVFKMTLMPERDSRGRPAPRVVNTVQARGPSFIQYVDGQWQDGLSTTMT